MFRKSISGILNATIPKAMGMACIGIALTFLLFVMQKHVLHRQLFTKTDVSDNKIFQVYSYALGVLLVFRNGQAYNRWWEGAQELRVATKQWHDACAQLVASSITSKASQEKIQVFNHMIVRLFSILQCSALQYVADMEDEQFEVLNPRGLGEDTINGLGCCEGDPKERMCMVFQWTMNAIYKSQADGIITAPPPILSRVFHGMNLGAYRFERMSAISATSLPHPYAHMIMILLYVHMFFSAVVISSLVKDPVWVCVSSFCSVFCYWSINFISIEIEQPFGDDTNDLPVRELQEESNHALKLLLTENFQHIPGQCNPSLQEMKCGMQTKSRMSQSRGLGLGHNAGQNDKHMELSLGLSPDLSSGVVYDTPALIEPQAQEPPPLVLAIPSAVRPPKHLPTESQPDAKLKHFSIVPAPPHGADAIGALERLASLVDRLSQSQSEIIDSCKEIRHAITALCEQER